MDRRTFLSLGGGALGATFGGWQLYRDVSGPSRPTHDDSGKTTVTPQETAVPSITEAGTPTPEQTDSPGEHDESTDTPIEEFDERDGQFLLGVTPQTSNPAGLATLEQWQGRQNAVVAVYLNLGLSRDDLLTVANDVLTPIWEHGSVPHVIWQPYLRTRETTLPTVPQDIAAGRHDRTLHRWTDVLGDWLRPKSGADRRLYLNFAPEMNGDWVPWDASEGNTTPDDYIAMYQRVHDIVTDTGLTETHIQWVWTVNQVGRGSATFGDFYPGSEYVDWCGVHGYNWSQWGGWTPPERLFDRALDALEALGDKPVTVSEYGCSAAVDGGVDVEKKAAWIRDVFSYFQRRNIRMGLWFNYEKETDWTVFDGSNGTETVSYSGQRYNAYREYRESVNADWVLPAYPNHPRRLTDAEFRGEAGR